MSSLYNVRRPLKDLSSEEFVLRVQSDKEISMTGSSPKTNSSELKSLSGCLTLFLYAIHPCVVADRKVGVPVGLGLRLQEAVVLAQVLRLELLLKGLVAGLRGVHKR